MISNKRKPIVIITGGTGVLGQELIRQSILIYKYPTYFSYRDSSKLDILKSNLCNTIDIASNIDNSIIDPNMNPFYLNLDRVNIHHLITSTNTSTNTTNELSSNDTNAPYNNNNSNTNSIIVDYLDTMNSMNDDSRSRESTTTWNENPFFNSASVTDLIDNIFISQYHQDLPPPPPHHHHNTHHHNTHHSSNNNNTSNNTAATNRLDMNTDTNNDIILINNAAICQPGNDQDTFCSTVYINCIFPFLLIRYMLSKYESSSSSSSQNIWSTINVGDANDDEDENRNNTSNGNNHNNNHHDNSNSNNTNNSDNNNSDNNNSDNNNSDNHHHHHHKLTVINVSSGDGELTYMHSQLQSAIENLSDLQAWERYVVTLLSTHDADFEYAMGDTPAYSVSKALLNSLTRILHQQYQSPVSQSLSQAVPSSVSLSSSSSSLSLPLSPSVSSSVSQSNINNHHHHHNNNNTNNTGFDTSKRDSHDDTTTNNNNNTTNNSNNTNTSINNNNDNNNTNNNKLKLRILAVCPGNFLSPIFNSQDCGYINNYNDEGNLGNLQSECDSVTDHSVSLLSSSSSSSSNRNIPTISSELSSLSISESTSDTHAVRSAADVAQEIFELAVNENDKYPCGRFYRYKAIIPW